MQARAGRKAVALAMILTVAGCGASQEGDRTNLMRLRSTDGPDEFAILPPKALEMPGDLAALPAPTPGGGNRTDQRPMDDAVIALGGRPGAAGGIPAEDAALAAHSTRMGSETNIRGQLASEDLDHRRRNKGRFFEKLFGTNSYYSAYKDEALNQQDENQYWRDRGLLTPSAPPPGYDKDAEEKARKKKLQKSGL